MKMEEGYEGIIMSKRVKRLEAGKVYGGREGKHKGIQEEKEAGERMIRFNTVIIKTQLSRG